ncbi:hypothetical protein [Embleya sp. NPDC059237]|uniref:hypothetical protein n=1 Tax=Embleya sp. NPDC059237 TaxID=3346784 RepID=UPI0036BB0572
MPEVYPSIGEAVGAAMQHNIRLAHGSRSSADSSSTPGMTDHVTETATQPTPEPPGHVRPTLSIGIHPRFGIVALTTDDTPTLAVRLLAVAGFDATGTGIHVLDATDDEVDDLLHAHNVVTVLRDAGVPVRSDLPPASTTTTVARAATPAVASRPQTPPAPFTGSPRPARHR